MIKSVESITFDGIELEEYFETDGGGYFLVNDVRGRGLFPAELRTTKVPNAVGRRYRGKDLPSRMLEVDFTLKGESFTHLNRQKEELTRIMHGRVNAPIQFSDEPGRTYYGTLGKVTDGTEKSHIYQATMQIECTDPHKYGDEKSSKSKSITLQGNTDSPFILKGVANSDFKDVKMTLGGEVLKLNYDFKQYDRIEIDTKREVVDVNGKSKNVIIDLIDADFFHLSPGQNVIKVSQDMDVEITYRERWL